MSSSVYAEIEDTEKNNKFASPDFAPGKTFVGCSVASSLDVYISGLLYFFCVWKPKSYVYKLKQICHSSQCKLHHCSNKADKNVNMTKTVCRSVYWARFCFDQNIYYIEIYYCMQTVLLVIKVLCDEGSFPFSVRATRRSALKDLQMGRIIQYDGKYNRETFSSK